MMYPTHVALSGPDYWALRTGSCIFGQLPTFVIVSGGAGKAQSVLFNLFKHSFLRRRNERQAQELTKRIWTK